ncbi:hypothetical protein C8A03DRAFT_14363 [Achaetomium macrosporum]|uniref:Transmembrane protein n=1 Tax=Achaetomium macrosporum TaxID=79813 RepID=A0AAN7CBY3_9PEZI|nr:hypothetical protein C8A03DRAFT_14363 [Achaetomium macrosporum]
MHRTKHFRWKLVHIFSILAHLGLAIAASISYVCDVNKSTRLLQSQWSYSSMTNVNPCHHLALQSEFGDGFMFDMAARTLLMTCLVVGALGLALNAALFIVLLAVEPNRITLTESEQHWRKQIVTFFGCILNLLLAGAGIGLALGMGAADSKLLIPPLVWASIQAPVAFVTAVSDAVKNYREGKDLLD